MAGYELIEFLVEGECNSEKWCRPLKEDVFKAFVVERAHEIFSDQGSLFNPLLFGKYLNPSDAFSLWDFEPDVFLSSLRSNGKTTVDWCQTDVDYVLKAELPDAGKDSIQVSFEKGRLWRLAGRGGSRRSRRLQRKIGEDPIGGSMDMLEGLNCMRMQIGGIWKPA